MTGDPAFYVKVTDGSLEGLIDVYVDDNLHAGNKEFERLTSASLRRFESTPRVYENFDFFGTMIKNTAEGELTITQS